MIRTVVTFSRKEALEAISGMLERNGITVRYRCRTGAEAIRAIKKMGGGVVVCGYKFPDMTAEHLAFELQGSAMLLVVAKPALLDLCEAEDVFRISAPAKAGELIGSVNMLIQFDQKKSRTMIPQRSQEDKETILKAKELIMAHNNMTEQQAHNFLQRRSMETSSKMADTARLVIASLE